MKRHEQQELQGDAGLPGSIPLAEDISHTEAKYESEDALRFQQHGSNVSWAYSRLKGK